MKISKRTIDILNKFYNINESIYFGWGTTIATKDSGGVGERSGRILATAKIEEEFPEIGIYNLKMFTNLLKNFKDPDLIFNDGSPYVIIKDEKKEAKYGIIFDKDTISSPAHPEIAMEDEYLSFILDKDNISTIKRVNSDIKVDENMILKIQTSENGLSIIVTHEDVKDNEFEIFINKDEHSFSEFVLDMDLFKYISNNDYKVSIHPLGSLYVVKMVSEDITYVCALKSFKD